MNFGIFFSGKSCFDGMFVTSNRKKQAILNTQSHVGYTLQKPLKELEQIQRQQLIVLLRVDESLKW